MVKRTYGTLPPPAPPAPERSPLGAPAGHSGVNNTPQLLPCPFCGAPAHGYAIAPHSHSPAVLRLVPELPDHPGCYVIEGQCACGSGLIGANESEVTARWNRRTPQQEAQEPGEIDRLRAALVYTAFALHGTPQYMLADGITLIDGDTVQVSRDGWKVQASINPLRQSAQPAPQPAPVRDYPPLPKPDCPNIWGGAYSKNQMHAYVDADRAALAARGGQ